METLKTIGQGALGAVTFGAYHQFTTNKIMELNNEKVELKHQQDMALLKEQHQREMKYLNDKYNDLEQKFEMMIQKQNKWF